MRIWEIGCDRYEERGGHYGGGSSYNRHDSEYSEGYERGYRDAMTQAYGERTMHHSGEGLSRSYYGQRDPYMYDDDMDMRRRRDRMGRFM